MQYQTPEQNSTLAPMYDATLPIEINWAHPEMELRIPRLESSIITDICWQIRAAVLLGTNGEHDWCPPNCVSTCLVEAVDSVRSYIDPMKDHWYTAVELDSRYVPAPITGRWIQYPVVVGGELYDVQTALEQTRHRCQKSGDSFIAIYHEPGKFQEGRTVEPIWAVRVFVNIHGDFSKYPVITEYDALYDGGPKLMRTDHRRMSRLENEHVAHDGMLQMQFSMPPTWNEMPVHEIVQYGYRMLRWMSTNQISKDGERDTFTFPTEWVLPIRTCLYDLVSHSGQNEWACAFYLHRTPTGVLDSWRGHVLASKPRYLLRDRKLFVTSRLANEDVLIFHYWQEQGLDGPINHQTAEFWMVEEKEE